MAGHQATPGRGDESASIFDGAFRLVVVLAAILGVLMIVRLVADAGGSPPAGAGVAGAASASSAPSGASRPPSPAASVDIGAYLDPFPRPAPPLSLTGSDGAPLALADLRGTPVLVFFGYTHCPDVCPVTIGAVGEAIDAFGGDAQAVFVSVDPERDTVPWLAEFVKYMPEGFMGVTGNPTEVKATADAWGVRYAKVDSDDPAAYAMAHTADVFIVDAAGQYRGRFPFGTEAATMAEVLREVAATTVTPTATPAPTPSAAPSASAAASATPAPAGIWPQVISTSVWAGGDSPVILALYDEVAARVDDPGLRVTAQLLDGAGAPVGPAVEAVTVQPVGVREVSYVPTLDIPSPGRWRVAVEAVAADGSTRSGVVDLTALDPGGSAALGQPAPTIRTPTAADFGGDLTWVTTDPLPDPRLSATSTTDALAAGDPFVLVVDSVRFRVTPVCGRAVVMAKQLLDRWRTVPFIHHEPYRYSVVTTEPVLEGTLQDPTLTEPAVAWGVGAPPWGVASMPWIFIVDGDGLVRAKYQGVMGSADVDVILSMLEAER